ncbi:MAG: DinB family protein [Acidobacteriota bacterium]
MLRPEGSEYAPYYEKYVSLVTEPDLLRVLEQQPAELDSLLGGLDEEKGKFTYAEGKWTVKEAISHLIDGERIFAYRALRISRGDETPMEGFEQDGYIENSYANERTFRDLLDELTESRRANLRMLRNLREDGWKRTGTASGTPISVRGLGYIMAGHVRHHINILRDQYLLK